MNEGFAQSQLDFKALSAGKIDLLEIINGGSEMIAKPKDVYRKRLMSGTEGALPPWALPIASAFGDTEGDFFAPKLSRPKIFWADSFSFPPKNCLAECVSRRKCFRLKRFGPHFLF